MNQFYNLQPSDVPAVPAEVARYMGYPVGVQPEQTVYDLITAAVQELRPLLQPRLVWDTFPLAVDESAGTCTICPGSDAAVVIQSNNLAFNLRGCSQVVLFAATIGAQIDGVIRRTSALDPVRASAMQATGAMFVESFVDGFNDFIKDQTAAAGGTNPARYSPGFGDCSLETQKVFFRLLNCSKIGLTLMDTLIMAPEKSVTAFIGIRR